MNWLNLRNRTAKIRFQMYIERLLKVYERRLYKNMSIYLREQYRNIARKIRSGDLRIDQIIYNNKEMYNMLMNFYHSVAVFFAEKFSANFERQRSKALFDVFWELYRSWASIYCAREVTRISKTTETRIKKLMEQGVVEKWSNWELSKQIFSLSEIESRIRANTIAITETHNMASKTTHDMATSEPSIREKEWFPANDERTREEHFVRDGKFITSGSPARIPVKDLFFVGGEYMRHPGDPSASGKNIVRCRCTELFHTRRQADLQAAR